MSRLAFTKKLKRAWAGFGMTFFGILLALALAAAFMWLYLEIVVPVTQ
jgi:hypothetical protein